jgi:phosphate transport system protein
MSPQRPFREELVLLKGRVVAMAGLAEENVRLSIEALQERSLEKADAVIAADSRIDDAEVEIDDMAIHLLALQQPMARDLRLITAIMKITNDLERVGDHAVNIARNVKLLVDAVPLRPPPEIDEMVRIAGGMLRDALDAFIREDSQLARGVGARDDRVDELHGSVFRVLLTHMMEDPRRIGAGMDLIMISRNLERIADLATNIAEDAVFLVEGRSIKHRAEERAAGEPLPARAGTGGVAL